MKNIENAAAEMIGAIALTSIIVAVMAIVGSQWIGHIPLSSPPYANLEIACGNSSMPWTMYKDNNITFDFNCRTGVIGCAPDELINYHDCLNHCDSIGTLTEKKACLANCQFSRKISYDECSHYCSISDPSIYQECLKECESAPNCANVENSTMCNAIFICHKGGDPLEINKLRLFINEDNDGKSSFWTFDDDKKEPVSINNGFFNPGHVLWYNIFDDPQTIKISYEDIQTGETRIMVSKHFR